MGRSSTRRRTSSEKTNTSEIISAANKRCTGLGWSWGAANEARANSNRAVVLVMLAAPTVSTRPPPPKQAQEILRPLRQTRKSAARKTTSTTVLATACRSQEEEKAREALSQNDEERHVPSQSIGNYAVVGDLFTEDA
jgi:hypothetical protein